MSSFEWLVSARKFAQTLIHCFSILDETQMFSVDMPFLLQRDNYSFYNIKTYIETSLYTNTIVIPLIEHNIV